MQLILLTWSETRRLRRCLVASSETNSCLISYIIHVYCWDFLLYSSCNGKENWIWIFYESNPQSLLRVL